MNLPKSIKIGGHVCVVKTHKKITNDNGDVLHGSYSPTTLTINIATDYPSSLVAMLIVKVVGL